MHQPGRWVRGDRERRGRDRGAQRGLAAGRQAVRLCGPDRAGGRAGVPGLSYGALLPNLGFNTAGVAHVADSVYPNDVRLGIPRIIYTRAILGSRTLGQAIQAAIHRRRDAGYNHLIAGEHGEIYCIEASATAYDALYADDHWTAHTNNYTSAMMRPYEEKPEALVNSRVRYNRARHLVKGRLGKLTVADFQTFLADHINYPNSICAHVEKPQSPMDCTVTIASIIMDMAERTCGYAGAIRARGRIIPIGWKPSEGETERELAYCATGRPMIVYNPLDTAPLTTLH